jgi:hypothetical protein
VFCKCVEQQSSGLNLHKLQRVSELEIFTTHIPLDTDKTMVTVKGWVSKCNKILNKVHVWMGADEWWEGADFSISAQVRGGPSGYVFTTSRKGKDWESEMVAHC